MIVLAHVSDLHVDGSAQRTDRLLQVTAYLEGLKESLDAVLVTGDLAEHGREAEYEQARILLKAHPTTLICPGNHDDRATLRRVLLRDSGQSQGPLNSTHYLSGMLIAVCDSSVPGEDHGRLDDETLSWLRGVLHQAPPEAFVLIALHHPPVSLHNPFVDAIRLQEDGRLEDLVSRCGQVAAVVCGHAHTAAVSTFAGRPLLVAPSVASTLRLPWEHAGNLDEQMPPAVAFHVITDDGRVTTHYRVVPG